MNCLVALLLQVLGDSDTCSQEQAAFLLLQWVLSDTMMGEVYAQNNFASQCLQRFLLTIQREIPPVFALLERFQCSALWFSEWLSSIFTNALNYPCLLRVWDIFLLEGMDCLYTFGINILNLLKTRLLMCTSEQEVLNVLRDETKELTADQLLLGTVLPESARNSSFNQSMTGKWHKTNSLDGQGRSSLLAPLI
jgi:hypothetical protein